MLRKTPSTAGYRPRTMLQITSGSKAPPQKGLEGIFRPRAMLQITSGGKAPPQKELEGIFRSRDLSLDAADDCAVYPAMGDAMAPRWNLAVTRSVSYFWVQFTSQF